MPAKIRPASPADLDDLKALSRRTVVAAYRAFLPSVEGFVASGASDRYVVEHLDRTTVLEVDGRVIGCSVVKVSLIDLMLIDPGHQRQGLGTALLRNMEEGLFGMHRELTLESFAQNEPANRFYRKNGWVEVRTYPDPKLKILKVIFSKSIAGGAQR